MGAFCLNAVESGHYFSEENCYSCVENESCLVDKDQILITEEGLFIDLGDGSAIPIQSISWLKGDHYKAFFGRPETCTHGVYCPSCGGCHPNNTCQNRCKCPRRRM